MHSDLVSPILKLFLDISFLIHALISQAIASIVLDEKGDICLYNATALFYKH